MGEIFSALESNETLQVRTRETWSFPVREQVRMSSLELRNFIYSWFILKQLRKNQFIFPCNLFSEYT